MYGSIWWNIFLENVPPYAAPYDSPYAAPSVLTMSNGENVSIQPKSDGGTLYGLTSEAPVLRMWGTAIFP
jgi:hypothetical protein